MAVNGNSPDVPWIMKNKVAETGDADASKRLTESSHWNSRWISSQSSDPEIPPPGRYRKIAERFIGPACLKQYLGVYRNGTAFGEPYAAIKTLYLDSYRDNFPSEPGVGIYPGARDMLSKN